MKKLYEEMRQIADWCFNCPYSDMRGVYKREGEDKDYDRMHFSSIKSPTKLITSFLGTAVVLEQYDNVDGTSKPVGTVSEEIPGEEVFAESLDKKSDEEVWKEWEKGYEISRKKWHTPRCPYLRKKGFEINLEREFEVPSDDCEMLRLLDKMSSCNTPECSFNRTEHLYFRTVDYMMQKAIAKIDFALIERGKDFGKLMSDMYFPYYDRKENLHECGYSWDLIRYYLDKYKITLYSKDEYEAMEKRAQQPAFASTAEFKDALNCGLCDEKGVLKVTKAEYTRKAAELYGIKNGYKTEWERFDGIFKEKGGKVISHKSFLQSFRDQEQKNINGNGISK